MAAIELDYVNEPNNSNLKHIPGDTGWPFLGLAPKLFEDQLALARHMYHSYGPLSRMQLATRTGRKNCAPKEEPSGRTLTCAMKTWINSRC